jgi:hypothetical protein
LLEAAALTGVLLIAINDRAPAILLSAHSRWVGRTRVMKYRVMKYMILNEIWGKLT